MFPDELVVADRVAAAAVVGVGQDDAGLLVGLDAQRAEHVVGDAGVELHADGEAADRAVGDGHAVVARVEHADALAGAVDEVAVEVDGDVRRADDEGDARALDDVVGEPDAAA